jgi:hypothetical protein
VSKAFPAVCTGKSLLILTKQSQNVIARCVESIQKNKAMEMASVGFY